MRTDLDHLVLLDKLQRIAYLILWQVDLVIGLHIHKMIEIIICVQILHILTVNMCGRALLCRTECLLYDTAVHDIL